ncbi:hypothetical protein P43SY_008872 [Pythium insidiosum]|uniref:Syntaxin-binding protein n=1 Tax=Pythium insidiosum TaxID=114742 RepID=A0AAD5MGF1_PYTIN|nr:hypothetical protein P43SY_008872 [Pythium insidiosum]
MDAAMTGSVATAHDVSLRQIVQDKVLHKMLKHITQITHGWVVLVVDDYTTRILSYAVRMSDLTDCGVSIVERLELNRQPFPEMNVVYFIAPTAENVRKMAQDFAVVDKPKYNDAYLFFLSHAEDSVLAELKNAHGLLPRLRALQEVHADFLALEKCAFSLDMNNAFHQLYSPAVKKDEAKILGEICDKLVSVCASLEEYPYVRYKADQPRMERLAQMFQSKMNAFVAKNNAFTYAPNRGTLFFMDRGQDLVAPMMHESTFQALIYDLIEVDEEQITYPAETNAGTVMKTAFLNENDKLWIEIKQIIECALKNTLDEQEYPYIIAPPLQSAAAVDEKKKIGPISLRKKAQQKTTKGDQGTEKEEFGGEKMLVFVCGGATYSELRSVYELPDEVPMSFH